MDITSLEFDKVRDWIRDEHDIKHTLWDVLFNKPAGYSVEEFLAFQVNMGHWPEMTVQDWSTSRSDVRQPQKYRCQARHCAACRPGSWSRTS